MSFAHRSKRSPRDGHRAQHEGWKHLVGDADTSCALIGGRPCRAPFAPFAFAGNGVSAAHRTVASLNPLRPPGELRRGADEVVLTLQGDAPLGLRVFQLLD